MPDSKMIKNKFPCQAVSNKLQIFELPLGLQNVRQHGKILIKGTAFQKTYHNVRSVS